MLRVIEKEKGAKMQYAQGDILIVKVRITGLMVTPMNGNIIAYNEQTGQKHRINGPARLFGWNGLVKYFIAEGDVIISHDEHPPIKLPRGTYHVRHQRNLHDGGNSAGAVAITAKNCE